MREKIIKVIEEWLQECREDKIIIGWFRENKLKNEINKIIDNENNNL